MISHYTDEEDFMLGIMLGIMLGYDRLKQCERFLEGKVISEMLKNS